MNNLRRYISKSPFFKAKEYIRVKVGDNKALEEAGIDARFFKELLKLKISLISDKDKVRICDLGKFSGSDMLAKQTINEMAEFSKEVGKTFPAVKLCFYTEWLGPLAYFTYLEEDVMALLYLIQNRMISQNGEINHMEDYDSELNRVLVNNLEDTLNTVYNKVLSYCDGIRYESTPLIVGQTIRTESRIRTNTDIMIGINEGGSILHLFQAQNNNKIDEMFTELLDEVEP